MQGLTRIEARQCLPLRPAASSKAAPGAQSGTVGNVTLQSKDKDEWSKNVVLLIYQVMLPDESITFNSNHISNSCYWSYPPESPRGPPQSLHDPFRRKRMQSLKRFFFFFWKCEMLGQKNAKHSAEVAKRPGFLLLLRS